jgi:hypothetical protein
LSPFSSFAPHRGQKSAPLSLESLNELSPQALQNRALCLWITPVTNTITAITKTNHSGAPIAATVAMKSEPVRNIVPGINRFFAAADRFEAIKCCAHQPEIARPTTKATIEAGECSQPITELALRSAGVFSCRKQTQVESIRYPRQHEQRPRRSSPRTPLTTMRGSAPNEARQVREKVDRSTHTRGAERRCS